MRFGVLGPLEVSGQDGPLPLGGPKQRIVLAHLVLSANKVVSAEGLIDALWGEAHRYGFLRKRWELAVRARSSFVSLSWIYPSGSHVVPFHRSIRATSDSPWIALQHVLAELSPRRSRDG